MQNNNVVTKKLFRAILAIVFWLALWLVIYKNVGTDLLVSSPLDVLKRLIELLNNKEFFSSILNSFLGITKGYALGVIFGFILGVLVAFSNIFSAIFKPFLTAVKTTPVVSFIILAFIWIPRQNVPVFITFLMVMPIIAAGVMTGLSSADTELLEMSKAYKFSFLKKLKYIYLPSSAPSVISSLETAIGLGWKAGIAAEVICMPDGTIGKALKNSQVYMETIDLFTWTAVVIIISLILEKILVALFDFIFKKAINKGGYFIEHKNK